MDTSRGYEHLGDEELLSEFEQSRLTPGEFHHREHVRMAWICVRKYGPSEAEKRLLQGIREMAERAGAPQKFLYTTTVAWVRLVAAAMPPEPAQNLSFASWVADHPRLLSKDCLSEFYSKAVLESPAARCGWVPPDLAPLPTQYQIRIVPG
jgi:hypothetical protein